MKQCIVKNLIHSSCSLNISFLPLFLLHFRSQSHSEMGWYGQKHWSLLVDVFSLPSWVKASTIWRSSCLGSKLSVTSWGWWDMWKSFFTLSQMNDILPGSFFFFFFSLKRATDVVSFLWGVHGLNCGCIWNHLNIIWTFFPDVLKFLPH